MPEPPEDWLPFYGVGITGPVPALMADLGSIARDLEFAAAAFAEMEARFPPDKDPQDELIFRALSEAALIAYRRAFEGGKSLLQKAKRPVVSQDVVASLGPAAQKMHDVIWEASNRHIAHRVNYYEQASVQVTLSNPTVGREVLGCGVISFRSTGFDDAKLVRARDLATRLAESVRTQLGEVAAGLIEEIKKENLDELYERARPMGVQLKGEEEDWPDD